MSKKVNVTGKNKYASLILRTKDAKDQAAAEEKIEDAKIQLDADVHQAKKDVNQAARALANQIADDNFDSSAIIEAQNELAVAEATYDALVKFRSEYFS